MATVPDASTFAWETELNDVDAWDVEKAKNFARYVKASGNRSILRTLDEERLQKLAKIDADAWNELARIYCEWAGSANFDFAYCDVIIGLIDKIFELGSTSLKTTAAIAAAKLGADHNRWYVMRRLLNRCGPKLDTTVAERLSIEIIAEDVQDKFICCVKQISLSANSYHPLIRDALAAPMSEADAIIRYDTTV
jgi:hypothetical protein